MISSNLFVGVLALVGNVGSITLTDALTGQEGLLRLETFAFHGRMESESSFVGEVVLPGEPTTTPATSSPSSSAAVSIGKGKGGLGKGKSSVGGKATHSKTGAAPVSKGVDGKGGLAKASASKGSGGPKGSEATGPKGGGSKASDGKAGKPSKSVSVAKAGKGLSRSKVGKAGSGKGEMSKALASPADTLESTTSVSAQENFNEQFSSVTASSSADTQKTGTIAVAAFVPLMAVYIMS